MLERSTYNCGKDIREPGPARPDGRDRVGDAMLVTPRVLHVDMKLTSPALTLTLILTLILTLAPTSTPTRPKATEDPHVATVYPHLPSGVMPR
jgi:hypothetical protein